MEIINGKPYKECAKCKVIKHFHAFGKNHAPTGDGRKSYCHQCENLLQRAYGKGYDWKRARRYRDIAKD